MDWLLPLFWTTLAVIGALSLLLGTLILLIRRFDTLYDLLRARFLKIVQPVFKCVAATRLKADIQGHLNTWIESLQHRLPLRVTMPKIVLKFHDFESSRRVLHDGGVLLLLDYNASDEENYCRAAAWMAGSMALDPAFHAYVPPYIVEAFELTIARLMLRDQKPQALAAFHDHVLQPASADPKVARYCAQLETIDDAGFLLRVLWPELNDYCQRQVGRNPTRRLRNEAGRFVRWLHDMAARKKGQLVPLRFSSFGINAAFHLVRDQQKGTPLSVHEKYILEELELGFPRIYVCARERSIPLVRQIAAELITDRRIRDIRLFEFDQVLIQNSVLDEVFRGELDLPITHPLPLDDDDGDEDEDFEDDPHLQERTTLKAVCAVVYNATSRVPVGTRESSETLSRTA